MNKKQQQITAFIFGITFVIALIALAIAFPNPTPFQYIVFKAVLSLAAAGVAAMIPGFISVTVPGYIRAGGALAVFVIVYFNNPAELIRNKELVQGQQNIKVLSHIREVDLTNWQYVSDADIHKKISSVVFVDKLTAIRQSDSTNEFMLRHATTSPIDPEITSNTHTLKIKQTVEQPKSGMRSKIRIFDVFIDISNHNIGEVFHITIKANYWNAINNPSKGWVGFPVIYGAKKATFTVTLPPNKPAKFWERREGSRDEPETTLVSDGAITFNKEKTNLQWNIGKAIKNWVYSFEWEW